MQVSCSEYRVVFCFLTEPLEISMRRPPLTKLNMNKPSLRWAQSSIDNVLQTPRDSLPQSPQDANVQERAKLKIITDVTSPVRQSVSWFGSPTDRNRCSSPIALYCTGSCRDNLNMFNHQKVLKADVVCSLLLAILCSSFTNRVARYQFRLRKIARCHGRIRMGSR